jgi:hypothetical protein
LGVNLKAKKRTERSALLSAVSKNKTFRDCAIAYMQAHESDYTSDKHRKQWPATLEAYAYPVIGNMLVSDIFMRDIKNILEQETTTSDGQTGKLWFVKTETAKREQDIPTVPSTIALELSTNPFLRCSDATVVASANNQPNAQTTNAAAVFGTLRRWKDNF